jgi:hydrogenase nickel insertion protein HypA
MNGIKGQPMHELSLVQALFSQLTSLATKHNKTRVLAVTVDIGPLAGVVTDSFQFAFDALAAESDLTKGAKLTILNPQTSYLCVRCGYRQSTPLRPDHCPECNETMLIPEGGDAIILNQVELE